MAGGLKQNLSNSQGWLSGRQIRVKIRCIIGLKAEIARSLKTQTDLIPIRAAEHRQHALALQHKISLLVGARRYLAHHELAAFRRPPQSRMPIQVTSAYTDTRQRDASVCRDHLASDARRGIGPP